MTSLYEKNLQGDIIGIIDESGVRQVSYVYDAWGKISETNITGTSTAANLITYNHLLYRGYYYDRETGLYYLQSRYYDPETGRFVNADGFVSTGQGILGCNMYTYCNNDPANVKDSSGSYPMDILSSRYSDNGMSEGNYTPEWKHAIIDLNMGLLCRIKSCQDATAIQML